MLAWCVECWRTSPLHMIKIPSWLDQPIGVGRGSLLTIHLEHPTVARTHAQLQWRTADELWVSDTNSPNGTRLNGQRITSARVVDGQLLSFGVPRLLFLFGDDAEARAQHVATRMATHDPITQLPLASRAAILFEIPEFAPMFERHGEIVSQHLEQLVGATLQTMFAGHPALTWLKPGAFGLPVPLDAGQTAHLLARIASAPKSS